MKSLLLFLLLLPVFVSGQVIETIAGNGIPDYFGDGTLATNASLNYPGSVKFDPSGNMYIADWNNNVIRKVVSSRVITTVVGNGYGAGALSTGGYTGDGGQATAAELYGPSDMAFDAMGNMYLCDASNNAIRKVNTAGIIITIAGGTGGYNGDNIAATSAQLDYPIGLILDHSGNIIFADEGNARVRKINLSTGIITTIAGNSTHGYGGDNGPASAAIFRQPCWIAMNSAGDIYIPDNATNRVRKIDNATGIITTVAGNGSTINGGDGGQATNAGISGCQAVAFDDSGNYYISSLGECSIRKVNTMGIISTVVGNDTACGYGGDGGPAIDAKINNAAICSTVDRWGNLYIADQKNNRVRMVSYHPVAVSNVSKAANNITIYPNPAQNEVTIKSTTAMESVEVVNMVGQVVVAKSSKEKEVLLDIRSLPAGVYFVKVNGVYGGRFLKE